MSVIRLLSPRLAAAVATASLLVACGQSGAEPTVQASRSDAPGASASIRESGSGPPSSTAAGEGGAVAAYTEAVASVMERLASVDSTLAQQFPDVATDPDQAVQWMSGIGAFANGALSELEETEVPPERAESATGILVHLEALWNTSIAELDGLAAADDPAAFLDQSGFIGALDELLLACEQLRSADEALAAQVGLACPAVGPNP